MNSAPQLPDGAKTPMFDLDAHSVVKIHFFNVLAFQNVGYDPIIFTNPITYSLISVLVPLHRGGSSYNTAPSLT